MLNRKGIMGFLVLLLPVVFSACNTKPKSNAAGLSPRKQLIQADKAFSAMSGAKGMKTAFIEYMDSNAVLLRGNRLPVVGANVVDFLIGQDDSDYTLTWEPHFADVAASGDFGYTYGVYELRFKSKDTSIYGSYTSIWKKQPDSKWKFVLETGNDGVGE